MILVRHALYDAPENVACLLKVVTTRLFNLVSDHTFPSVPNASVASFATSFIRSSTGNPGRNTTKEVLNCLRILQRVLPVVFELEGDSSRLEMEVFWRRDAVSEEGQTRDEPTHVQFVIEDDEDDDDEHDEPLPGSSQKPPPKTAAVKKTLPSLAERLFSCLIDLLFCCGFTLPNKIQVDHYKINYVIWYAPLHLCSINRSNFFPKGERCRFYNRTWSQPDIRE